MKRTVQRLALASAALVVAALLAVPAFGRGEAVSIKMTATEMKFLAKIKTAPAGSVTFLIVNRGKLAHDFKIAGKKTKLIKPGGQSATLKVTLKKGKYTYICTVPGHAAAGMKGVFTVK